jgi:hypothetical protein
MLVGGGAGNGDEQADFVVAGIHEAAAIIATQSFEASNRN